MTENGPDRPYTDYGKSKWKAEQIVKKFQNEKKLQTIILRPCWFYGPNPGPIMIELINRIKNGRPPIFGDGSNLRTMSYIENTVEAILLAINNDRTNGNTYWIGDEKPYKLIDVYNEFAKQLNVKINPWKIPWSVCQLAEKLDIFLGKLGRYHKHLHVCGETGHDIWCDTIKAQNDFDYNPKISLREGVKRTIESARKLGLSDEK
jgi:nucleoside-diphosphate-sugar epimerase